MRFRQILLAASLTALVSSCRGEAARADEADAPATSDALRDLTSGWCVHYQRALDTDVEVPTVTSSPADPAATTGAPVLLLELDTKGIRVNRDAWIPWAQRTSALDQIEAEIEMLATIREVNAELGQAPREDTITWSLAAAARLPASDVIGVLAALPRYDARAGEVWLRRAGSEPIPAPSKEAARLLESLASKDNRGLELAEYLAPLRTECPALALPFAEAAGAPEDQQCTTMLEGVWSSYDSCDDASLRARVLAGLYVTTAAHRPERYSVPLVVDAALTSTVIPEGETWGEWVTKRLPAPGRPAE